MVIIIFSGCLANCFLLQSTGIICDQMDIKCSHKKHNDWVFLIIFNIGIFVVIVSISLTLLILDVQNMEVIFNILFGNIILYECYHLMYSCLNCIKISFNFYNKNCQEYCCCNWIKLMYTHSTNNNKNSLYSNWKSNVLHILSSLVTILSIIFFNFIDWSFCLDINTNKSCPFTMKYTHNTWLYTCHIYRILFYISGIIIHKRELKFKNISHSTTNINAI